MIWSPANLLLALRLIIRSRALVVAAIVGAILFCIAWLAGQFSPRQPSTVALDVGLSYIRLAVPIIALLQIQDLVARDVERRLVLTSLTYPHPRTAFLLGRFAAVVLVALANTLFFCGLLALAVTWVGHLFAQTTVPSLGFPFLLTSILIWLDALVVIGFGLLLATVSTTPHLVFLGGIGFMIIARSASTIIQLLEAEKNIVRGAEWYHQGLQWVQWIVPDLASLDVRAITLYGKMELLAQNPWALALMPISYAVVLMIVSSAIFSRRRFD